MSVEPFPEDEIISLVDRVIEKSEPALLDLSLLELPHEATTMEEARSICYTSLMVLHEVQALSIPERVHYLRFAYGDLAVAR